MAPVSAHDVAAELRVRLPGVPTKKLHKLLYYCQGHHLAACDEPLFWESVSAWDMGPVVDELWRQEKLLGGPAQAERPVLTEAQLNTVGYVVSRYGALSGTDLEHLTHSESPWQRADSSRRPHDWVRIERDWMREYFRTEGAPGADESDAPLDSAQVTAWLEDAAGRRDASPGMPDDMEALRARLEALRGGAAAAQRCIRPSPGR